MVLPQPPYDEVVNLFTNPENESNSTVVVWENLAPNPSFEHDDNNITAGSATTYNRTSFENAIEYGDYALSLYVEGATSTNGFIQQRINVTGMAGKWGGLSLKVRRSGSSGARYARLFASFIGSSVTGFMASDTPLGQAAIKQLPRISGAFEIPEGATEMRLWLRFVGEAGSAPDDGSYHTDAWVIAVGDTEEEALWKVQNYFDEGITFDSDLTPQPRPGGGSQLVGQAVAGLTTSSTAAAVVVQSRQWAKSGEVSARVINTSGAFSYALWISGGQGETGVVHVYLDEPITEFSRNYFGPSDSDYAVMENRTGEQTLRMHRAGGVNSWWAIPSPLEIGESVWFDLLTVTDTENYTGPPFSGDSEPFEYDSQIVVPQWRREPNNSESFFRHYIPLDYKIDADWHSAPMRTFTIGVDRGYLYVGSQSAPWSGLVNVNVDSPEGEVAKRYLDGEIYHIQLPPSDFSGSLEAYTYPRLLESRIGIQPLTQSKLRAHGQAYQPFNMTYRTMVGDGTSPDSHYRLHFLYNVYAVDSGSDYSTINASPEPGTFSFDLYAIPEEVTGFRNTSYFEIDSRDVNKYLLEFFEGILYGSEGTTPTLPTVQEIKNYFGV